MNQDITDGQDVTGFDTDSVGDQKEYVYDPENNRYVYTDEDGTETYYSKDQLRRKQTINPWYTGTGDDEETAEIEEEQNISTRSTSQPRIYSGRIYVQ